MIATIQPTLTPANALAVLKKYGGKEIKPVAPLNSGLVMGIFAPGGVGKTTVAATITDSELGRKALYFNCRGNPFVIYSKRDQIDVVDVEKFSDIEAVRKDIVNDKDCPYKSLIFDVVTEMHAMRLRELYPPTADISWEMHSAASQDIKQLVRNAVDLAEGSMKMNVIFIFQEAQENRTIRGQKNVLRSEISLSRSLQNDVPGLINMLGRLYITEDTPPFTRMLDFTPIETQHQAKFQKDPFDDLMKTVPFEQYNPSLGDLLDTLRGRKPWPAQKHNKPTLVAGGNRS